MYVNLKLFLSIYKYLRFFQVLNFTFVELNRFAEKAKLLKTAFSKATVVMRFPAKKNAGCPKAPRDFPPRKDGILHSPSGCLGTPLPFPHSLYGRPFYGRTLSSQPK